MIFGEFPAGRKVSDKKTNKYKQVKNTISERIFDFLKDFPPFQFLTKTELSSIAENIHVFYVEKDKYVFRQNDPVHPDFYVVKDGAVVLESGEKKLITDQCDEGDVFGLRAVIRKKNYMFSARALEESIIYCIPNNFYEEIILKNTEANRFLLATFAGNLKKNDSELISPQDNLNKVPAYFQNMLCATYSKNPVTCGARMSVKQAAEIMTNKRVGSIVIVSEKNFPVGILTDKDLRTKIATGKVPLNAEVTMIMSSPVITHHTDLTMAEAEIAMLHHNIGHICLTEDGTPESKILGILSEHDLLSSRGNHPAAFIKEIKRAANATELKKISQQTQRLMGSLLDQHIPVDFVLKVISLINQAMNTKIIELSLAEMQVQAPVSFTWLALGSQGRKEQLLLSDQDNALIYCDVTEKDKVKTERFFLDLANKINYKLEEVGFEYCPAGMMANNPKWCLSLSSWKEQFRDWITNPNEEKILLCNIFFDYHGMYGNADLPVQLGKSILDSIQSHEIFLNRLALNAIQNPPPLGFFRQFLLEHSGEHKDQFDIKARAIMPLVDSARVLILSNRVTGITNTLERFEKLINLEPQNKDIYILCLEAYKILLNFRAKQGLANKDNGRFVNINALNKFERLQLKNCFKPISEVHELIKVRFNLAQLL